MACAVGDTGLYGRDGMAELNLERITALSHEPPNVLQPDAPQPHQAQAANAALYLLAVLPSAAQAVSSDQLTERHPTG